MLFQAGFMKKCQIKWKKKKIQRFRQREKHNTERKCSHKWNLPLTTPKVGSIRPERASLCTFQEKWKRASLAIETALALPIFLLGMVTLISFMDIYQVQTEHLTKLCERTKEAGMYRYSLGEEGSENVTLGDLYVYRPVGGFLPRVWMYSQVRVRAWTGKERETGPKGEGQLEAMVYVAENGEVYHKSLDCTYLNLTVTQALGSSISSLKNKYGEKYRPCGICCQGKKPGPLVFITETGDCYHNQEDCSGLKRTVHLVSASKAKGMRPCPRCG